MAVLSFVLGTLASCDIGDSVNTSSCPTVIGISATAVTGPTEAQVNEEISLPVSFKIASACGDFNRFYVDPNGLPSERTITVNATYDACDCDNVYTTETEPYKFKAATAGTYTLKFKTTNTTFVTHVVTVE